jgi:hypothetical protein
VDDEDTDTQTHNRKIHSSGQKSAHIRKMGTRRKTQRDFCGLQLKTGQVIHAQAHSKHSKRFYALYLRFANSSTEAKHYEQRVGRFSASYVLRSCGVLTTTTRTAAVNTYEQKIRKNCSNAVGR